MRHSFGMLIQTTRDFAVDTNATTKNSLSSSDSFLRNQINQSVGFIFSLMKKYKLQPLPRTASTVANQIYYHYPPSLSKIESITVDIGTRDIPLRCVDTQEEWNLLQSVPVSSSFPTHYFPRRDDFGIYPTPSDAFTMTLVANYNPRNMTVIDYTSGTVDLTQNSATITGTDTTFTAKMTNRWFATTTQIDDGTYVADSDFYRLKTFSSTTSFALESVFEGTSISGTTYLIGESPEIPEELHEFIPYRAAATSYGTRRRSGAQAQRLMNFFYTGDFDNTKRDGTVRGGVIAALQELKERGRNNDQIVEMGPTPPNDLYTNTIWGTQLSAP